MLEYWLFCFETKYPFSLFSLWSNLDYFKGEDDLEETGNEEFLENY